MANQIDINCDMGEGLGRYTLGPDAELMPFISSANIACGWHAGDPAAMRTTVEMALAHDVGIGAHPSFPDLLGFGLHSIVVTPVELYDYVLYQVGALHAFIDALGGTLGHIKPHGGMYLACSTNRELADALMKAARVAGQDLTVVLMGEIGREAAEEAGVKYVREGFLDVDYEANGGLVFEKTVAERALIDWDPERVAKRAVQICTEGSVETVEGGTLLLDVDTLCLHGDLPRAVASARRARERLDEVGVRVASFRNEAPNS